MLAMLIPAKELRAEAVSHTTPTLEPESSLAATTSMLARTVPSIALTGNPEIGHRTPAVDGNRLVNPSQVCSTNSKHEQWVNSALRTSAVRGPLDFRAEEVAEGSGSAANPNEFAEVLFRHILTSGRCWSSKEADRESPSRKCTPNALPFERSHRILPGHRSASRLLASLRV
jgi:hypothetical protein